MRFLLSSLLMFSLIAITIIIFKKVRNMPKQTKKKVYIICGCVFICCVLVIGVMYSIIVINNKHLTVEESLLGEWIAKNDTGEATIIFEKEDNEYIGEWSVFDYENKEWTEKEFMIKDIDNHIMTILLDDGKIDFIPFSVSKDTLFFANVEYKNEDKNIPIPLDEYTYIVDGVIRPVTYGCYMGMSKEEIEKTVAPLEVEHEKSGSYCILPEEKYGDIKIVFNFDDDYGLDKITYFIDDDYYDEKQGIIKKISELYGDYKKESWATSEDDYFNGYYKYIWNSGNLIIILNENTKEESIWLSYEINFDWELEYRRNNKK